MIRILHPAWDLIGRRNIPKWLGVIGKLTPVNPEISIIIEIKEYSIHELTTSHPAFCHALWRNGKPLGDQPHGGSDLRAALRVIETVERR